MHDHQAGHSGRCRPTVRSHAIDILAQLSKACGAGHGLVADIIDVQQEEGSLVAAGVSDRLDALKGAYHALPGALTRVVEAELARIPRALSHNLSQQTWTCVYVPQVLSPACLRYREAALVLLI